MRQPLIRTSADLSQEEKLSRGVGPLLLVQEAVFLSCGLA